MLIKLPEYYKINEGQFELTPYFIWCKITDETWVI